MPRILPSLISFFLLLSAPAAAERNEEEQPQRKTSARSSDEPTSGDDAAGTPTDEAGAERTAPTVEAEEKPAQPSTTKEEHQKAALLKEKADDLFRARHYLDAITVYEQAYDVYADPRILYNKGRALEALGMYGEAYATLRQFQREAPSELKDRLTGLAGLLEALRDRVGELQVRVNVPGAEIMWGRQVIGSSPLREPILVNSGKKRLRVVKDGYFAYESEVDLAGGGSATLQVILESKSRHAKLRIDSNIEGAQIEVDDEALGVVPTEAVLEPGPHRITAAKPGYRTATSQIILESGQFRTITVDPLVEHKPVYARWWFWGGIAALAAGAATTAILIESRPDHTSGDFSPDTVVGTRPPLFQF